MHDKVLRKDRGPEKIESAQRLAEENLNVQRKLTESRLQKKKAARKKIEMAEHHWKKATMRYQGWIPWLIQLRAAQLDYTKATRVHQYCLMQRMWTNWMSFVQRSRAATTRLMKYKVLVFINPFGAKTFKHLRDNTGKNIDQRRNIQHPMHNVRGNGS